MLNRRIGKGSLRKGPKENGPHGFIYIESIPSPFIYSRITTLMKRFYFIVFT